MAAETIQGRKLYEEIRYIFDLSKKTLSGSQTTTPDTLRFLIPGMCHLVAEDKPRKIILEMKMHETLFTYLSYHWTIFDSHKHWLKEQVRKSLIYNLKLVEISKNS